MANAICQSNELFFLTRGYGSASDLSFVLFAGQNSLPGTTPQLQSLLLPVASITDNEPFGIFRSFTWGLLKVKGILSHRVG